MLDCVQAIVEPSVNISTLLKCGFSLAEERMKWKMFFSHMARIWYLVGMGGGGGFRLHRLYKVQFLFCLTCPTHTESINLKL